MVVICSSVPIAVTTEEVEKNAGYGQIINRLIELYVKREMESRKIGGFNAVLIEFFDDGREAKFYFDDEVQYRIHFRKAGMFNPLEDIGKTKTFNLRDIKNIEAIEETLDPNSAKAYIIRWGKPKTTHWILWREPRFNKQVAKGKLERAKEFLSAAERLKIRKHFNVSIYLMWSVLELTLDAYLWMLPNHKPQENHQDRLSKLEKLAANSSILSAEFCRAFKNFSQHKDAARYAQQTVREGKKFNKAYVTETIKFLRKMLKNDPFLRM